MKNIKKYFNLFIIIIISLNFMFASGQYNNPLIFNLLFIIFFIYTLYFVIKKQFLLSKVTKIQIIIYILSTVLLILVFIFWADWFKFGCIIIWTKYTFIVYLLLLVKDKVEVENPQPFDFIINVWLILPLILLPTLAGPLGISLLSASVIEVIFRL